MYRVLVVDDEKLERDGIRFLLSMEEGEWEIYEAANGKLALNELRKHPVDLMLTDIKMPHMDGLELSKKAREEYPDLEIIIFSGYGDFAFAQEAIPGSDQVSAAEITENNSRWLLIMVGYS